MQYLSNVTLIVKAWLLHYISNNQWSSFQNQYIPTKVKCVGDSYTRLHSKHGSHIAGHELVGTTSIIYNIVQSCRFCSIKFTPTQIYGILLYPHIRTLVKICIMAGLCLNAQCKHLFFLRHHAIFLPTFSAHFTVQPNTIQYILAITTYSVIQMITFHYY